LSSYAYDFSAVPGPSADAIKANEGVGALTYGTGAQQSQSYLNGLSSSGLHLAKIWEHNSDSIIGGYQYGVAECQAWEATHDPGMVYLACDLNDGQLGNRSPLAFVAGWYDTTRENVFGIYGPDHAIIPVRDSIFADKCCRYWGVVNWLEKGYPDNDPRNIAQWSAIGAHLVQLIGSPIPGTDQNLVLQQNWWDTGSAPSEDDDMIIYITKKSDPSVGVWACDSIFRRWVQPSEWAFINYIASVSGKPAPTVLGVADDWWNSLPDASIHGSSGTTPTSLSLSGSFTGTAKA
jgi:hypothetical protein